MLSKCFGHLVIQVKEASTKKVGDDEELLAELKLQGLSEDQACWVLALAVYV